jgi:hypothetical protein
VDDEFEQAHSVRLDRPLVVDPLHDSKSANCQAHAAGLEVTTLTGGTEATDELCGTDQKDNTRDISDGVLGVGQT